VKLCAVVPVFNHAATAGEVIAHLARLGLPCILVDDGSDAAAAAILDQVAARSGASLLRHARNRGKGAAVLTGLRHASAGGFSHALQIDADGQLDPAEAPALILAATRDPQAVVTGYPVYEEAPPAARYYGRFLTHLWVRINTMSGHIRDSMCGFRVYPLATVLGLVDGQGVGERMDFDIEILVRLDWAGVRIVNVPVHVRYPAGGSSHFRLIADNALITAMHTRLFFGMLVRGARLLRRRLRSAS
jgi:glycosyltransferase involved in cell wall biosynthesis